MGLSKILCFILFVGVVRCNLWNNLSPFFLAGNHSAKGIYFVPTSAADSTPLLVTVEGDAQYNDYVFWYSWDATSSQFVVEQQFALDQTCNVASSADSSSFVVNATDSPTGHPLLFFGCASRPPIILDLWTLDVTPLNNNTNDNGLMVQHFVYTTDLPQLIFGSSAYDVFAWDLQTSQLIWSCSGWMACYSSTSMVTVGDAFVQAVWSEPESYLLQWDAKSFYGRKDPAYNVSIPAPVSIFFAPPTASFLFGVGRYFPPYVKNNTAFLFSVADGASPRTVEEFELTGIAKAALPSQVITIDPYAVVSMTFPSILVTLLTEQPVMQVEVDQIPVPAGYSSELGDLIVVPKWAQAQFPFAFILQIDLFPPLGGFTEGSILVPYTWK